jgi:hypothetical protein
MSKGTAPVIAFIIFVTVVIALVILALAVFWS